MAKKNDKQVTLEESVIRLLKERNLTLTTTESITGGMVAARLTDVSGASEVFKQGLVTYCNKAKRNLLNVKKSTLKKHGAVSKKTAKEMAKNGALITGADVCISLTGIAGPGTEEDKPVGLVYIGCYFNDSIVVEECHFEGDRATIRENAVKEALTLLCRCVSEE